MPITLNTQSKTFFVTPGNTISIVDSVPANGGVALTLADSHTYSVGDPVIVSNSVRYNGVYRIKTILSVVKVVIDTSNTESYTGTHTGLIAKGNLLKDFIGVPKTVRGKGPNIYSEYFFGQYKISISGALLIDPRKEVAIGETRNFITVKSNGGLILGVPSTGSDGFVTQYPMPAIINVVGTRVNFWSTDGTLKVNSGGYCEWNGCVVNAGSTTITFNGYLKVRDAHLIISGIPDKYETRGFVCRVGGVVDVINWNVIGGEFDPIGFTGTLLGLKRSFASIGFLRLGGKLTDFFSLSLGKRSNTVDAALQIQSNPTNLFDLADGTDLRILGGVHRPDARNTGRVTVQKRIAFKFEDYDGFVGGARYFIRDTDNGERKNVVTKNSSSDDVTYNDLPYLTYSETSSELTGVTPEISVVAGIVVVPYSSSGNIRGVVNEGLYTVDLRGKTNVLGEDLFDAHIWSYAHNYVLSTKSLKGIGLLEISVYLVKSTEIFEPSRAIVSTYTGITIDHEGKIVVITQDSTLEKVVDYIKYNKTLVENIEKPTLSTLFSSRNGMEIDFSDYSIHVSSNKILYKTDKVDTFITTGIFTGSTNCYYSDSVTDSRVEFVYLSDSMFEGIYSSRIDADIGGDNSGRLGTENIYAYSSNSSGTTVYIRLLRSGEKYIQSYVLPVKGFYVFNLSEPTTLFDNLKEMIEVFEGKPRFKVTALLPIVTTFKLKLISASLSTVASGVFLYGPENSRIGSFVGNTVVFMFGAYREVTSLYLDKSILATTRLVLIVNLLSGETEEQQPNTVEAFYEENKSLLMSKITFFPGTSLFYIGDIPRLNDVDDLVFIDGDTYSLNFVVPDSRIVNAQPSSEFDVIDAIEDLSIGGIGLLQ